MVNLIERERVFVNGRGRDVILRDMGLRIERGDIQMERQQAIEVTIPISLLATETHGEGPGNV